MAPEYAMEGVFSVKSDVFSFGVILLRLLVGKGIVASTVQNMPKHSWHMYVTFCMLELEFDKVKHGYHL